MPRQKQVTIEFKKSGKKTQTGTCLVSALPVWEDLGWTAVDDGTEKPDKGVKSTGTDRKGEGDA